MTSSSAPETVPVLIRVLLPGDQDVVGRLWSKRQVRDGWPGRRRSAPAVRPVAAVLDAEDGVED
ncbi:hypothetical protein ACFXPW_31695 [Streptomyces goshikiensis]|uniref:hypothetical protein n=1 Tax=Streptomyces goshikiensis TaxID=1942 RepID=UPI00367EBAA8